MTRVEEIRQQIRELETELFRLTVNENNEVIEAVASSRSVKAAAEKLEVSEKTVKNILEGIPHLYGESWPFACRRYLREDPVVDNFEYPQLLLEKFESVLSLVQEKGFAAAHPKILEWLKSKGEIPEETKTLSFLLGRLLQKKGYNTKGSFEGIPDWIS